MRDQRRSKPFEKPAPARPIEEVKVHLDGRQLSFTCELVALDRRGSIIAWRNPSNLEFPLFTFPAGSLSHGFFWRRRRHNLYRFSGPDGDILGYRLDIIRAPSITADRVLYTDLMLDIVQKAGDKPLLEDVEELEEAAARRLISPHDATRSLAYARRLKARLPGILRQAESWLAEYS